MIVDPQTEVKTSPPASPSSSSPPTSPSLDTVSSPTTTGPTVHRCCAISPGSLAHPHAEGAAPLTHQHPPHSQLTPPTTRTRSLSNATTSTVMTVSPPPSYNTAMWATDVEMGQDADAENTKPPGMLSPARRKLRRLLRWFMFVMLLVCCVEVVDELSWRYTPAYREQLGTTISQHMGIDQSFPAPGNATAPFPPPDSKQMESLLAAWLRQLEDLRLGLGWGVFGAETDSESTTTITLDIPVNTSVEDRPTAVKENTGVPSPLDTEAAVDDANITNPTAPPPGSHHPCIPVNWVYSLKPTSTPADSDDEALSVGQEIEIELEVPHGEDLAALFSRNRDGKPTLRVPVSVHDSFFLEGDDTPICITLSRAPLAAIEPWAGVPDIDQDD
ncbi:hypothetical protein DL93DRAFT_2078341 [Clavulina sp. PMI_390]|nr:hypothetical protein DL93DRAFT_2078341 [Clavulina sp. PMI_390]